MHKMSDVLKLYLVKFLFIWYNIINIIKVRLVKNDSVNKGGLYMITGEIKNKIDKIWTDIWAGGLTNPITVVEQLTYLMFLRSMDDVPLMEGLTQVEETATFDQPDEKMVIVNAVTQESTQEVSQFYHQTLVNLGWNVILKDHYLRGKDTLTLEFSNSGKQAGVQFTLVLSH